MSILLYVLYRNVSIVLNVLYRNVSIDCMYCIGMYLQYCL